MLLPETYLLPWQLVHVHERNVACDENLLTAKVEQVSKEEAGLVEGLKLWKGALLEVSSQWLSPSLL